MKTLFNDGWLFAELPIDEKTMFKTGSDGDSKVPVLFTPDQFLAAAENLPYKPVTVPHDWQIHHVKDLYRNSAGFYKKSFEITEDDISVGGDSRYLALRFEAVYMNSAVWINGKKAGEWKYGYSTFEFDISKLVHAGENEILVIAVYQNCNTRWYSGAGIIRDVYFINSPSQHLASNGVYFSTIPMDENMLDGEWKVRLSTEICHAEFISAADNEIPRQGRNDIASSGITNHFNVRPVDVFNLFQKISLFFLRKRIKIF